MGVISVLFHYLLKELNFLSWESILQVKIKNIFDEYLNSKLLNLQFWSIPNVNFQLGYGNVYVISKFEDIDFYFCPPLGAVCSGKNAQLLCGVRIELAIGSLPYPQLVWVEGVQTPWMSS